jgi:OPA family glycerol-3-phosphate transporter-like MFS transporter/OPA family sugar phosphate sensor protein UhpC-like MFS transporter
MATAARDTQSAQKPGGIFGLFRPAPPADNTATDPADIARGFRHWQPRILFSSIVGYAMFYFVRTNLPVAMPYLQKDLGITKTDLGLFLTLQGVVYGISKFANGFFGDRCNARTFMATGLLLSAAANVAFGSASTALWLGIFWVLNGWFQGMGFPPCARLLTHWFAPRNFATKMALWNTSHSIGAGLVVVLCGYLVVYDWRLCFYVPAALAACAAIYLLLYLRDTPESLGLPPVEQYDAAAHPHAYAAPPAVATAVPAESEPEPPFFETLRDYVFSNPYIWLVSLANFFVYTIRYAFLNWAPTFLSEYKGVQIHHAAWMTAGFELAGLAGAVASGYLTDRYFGGRPIRLSLIAMLACAGSIFLFWRIPTQSEMLSTILIASVGFFIYIPQCLIGIAAAKLATKRAAATAVGLTGLFGYASTLLSGVGLGYLVQHYGWPAGFLTLVFVAAIASLIFAVSWFAPAYRTAK